MNRALEGVFPLSNTAKASDGGVVIGDLWVMPLCMGKISCPATTVPVGPFGAVFPAVPGRCITSLWQEALP